MRLPMIYNYHVIDKISNGAFGVVWKAIHNDSVKEEVVAIKIERKKEREKITFKKRIENTEAIE